MHGIPIDVSTLVEVWLCKRLYYCMLFQWPGNNTRPLLILYWCDRMATSLKKIPYPLSTPNLFRWLLGRRRTPPRVCGSISSIYTSYSLDWSQHCRETETRKEGQWFPKQQQQREERRTHTPPVGRYRIQSPFSVWQLWNGVEVSWWLFVFLMTRTHTNTVVMYWECLWWFCWGCPVCTLEPPKQHPHLDPLEPV